MTQNLSIELIFFGGILTTASVALLNAHPEVGRITLISGVVGGSICLVMGLLGMIGRSSRKVASLILVLIAAFAAVRAVMAWTKSIQGAIKPMEPLWFSVFVLFSSFLATTMLREGK